MLEVTVGHSRSLKVTSLLTVVELSMPVMVTPLQPVLPYRPVSQLSIVA